ncbi:uncharacterized protein LOC104303044 [Dryobates pubescens]|nr:uncharacterized protein LOC104303044 [Dryobates pubescens]
MDCGVVTSKSVLLLLSLGFWVARGAGRDGGQAAGLVSAGVKGGRGAAVVGPVLRALALLCRGCAERPEPSVAVVPLCSPPRCTSKHNKFRFCSIAFQAASAGLGYVGGYVINTYKSYDNFLQDKYALLPAVIILCVALVMFIIGLIGCCATFRESRVGLGLFLAIILVIFVAEVSAFVLGFVYREKVKTDVQGTMSSVFERYDGKNPESTVVDYLQEQLHCCGVKNYSDWTTTQWFNSTGNNSVPLSCCRQELRNCTGRLDQPQELNTQGCAEELESGLQSVFSYAMLVILGFAIVKVDNLFLIDTDLNHLITAKQDNKAKTMYDVDTLYETYPVPRLPARPRPPRAPAGLAPPPERLPAPPRPPERLPARPPPERLPARPRPPPERLPARARPRPLSASRPPRLPERLPARARPRP